MVRFVLVSCAFLLVALPAYAQGNGTSHDGGGKRSTANANSQPAQVALPNYLAAIDSRLRQIARHLDSKIAEDQSAKTDERAERDVKAQERVADYAPWMLALGAVEIVITAIGVWLVRKTILESRAATEDDIRPYVQMSRCKFSYARGVKPRFIVKIQNSGQTPATFFEVCFSAIATTSTDDSVNWEMPPKLRRKNMWNALGGDDDVTVALYDPEISNIITDAFENKILFVCGRVRYGDIWRNEYETEFAYWLRDVSPTLSGNMSTGLQMNPRKMSRATGALRTFVLTKKAET